MKKFQFKLDTDSINRENEEHSNGFHMKVKNLAEHCVKFLEGSQNEIDCSDNKFDRNIHDDQEDITGITNFDRRIKGTVTRIIQFQVTDLQNVTQKLLI